MLEPGQSVGHYRLDTALTNASRNLFLATDEQNGRCVVLKITAHTEEAIFLKKIQHPNVIHLLDTGATLEGQTYLVLEHLEGQPLNERIPRDLGLGFTELWPWIKQLASALQAVHSMGVMHLDIRPSNVLVIPNPQGDRIKLIDFGIAQRKGDPAALEQKPIGTPGYVAPERILKSPEPEPRADIYSFGALLAFALSGKRPFSGQTSEEILAAQLKGEMSALNCPRLRSSPQLLRIINRATALNPSERYTSIAEFFNALSAYQRSPDMPEYQEESPDEKDPSENPTETQIGRFIIGAGILGVILLTALIYYFLFSSV